MTLLMITVSPDFAAIAADELTYNPTDGTGLGRTSKVSVMTDIDTLVAGSGLTRLHTYAVALLQAQQPADYDQLIEIAPELLRHLWDATEDLDPVDYLVIHAVGWSPTRQSFTAHWFPSTVGFEPIERDAGALVVVPPLEAPLQALQAGVEGWVQVAERVRAEQLARAEEEESRTLIGGRLWYTELTRGRVVSEVVHQFDDTPELWTRYLRGLLDAEQIEHESQWAQRSCGALV